MIQFQPDNWYVAQLKPQGLRRAMDNLTRQGFLSFCPNRLESAVVRGKLQAKERPLFPGYLFVQFDPRHANWSAINATRGITRLILTDVRNPYPIPTDFMAGLIARCDDRGRLGAPPDLRVGDRIRVLSGPFADTVANIETLRDDERIQILMDVMGQAVRLSLPTTGVEKLGE